MGIPVNTIYDFEGRVKKGTQAYTMIIFANAESDSKAADFIRRNFHVMDTISDDVDFYLAGYNADFNRSPEKHKWEEFKSLTGSESNFCYISINQNENPNIDSPRLGEIIFNKALYADFVLELSRRNRDYRYTGACQLIIVPIIDSQPDYAELRSYDLDAIVDCPSGPSLDYFIHNIFHLIRDNKISTPRSPLGLFSNRHRRLSIFETIDSIYKDATTTICHEDKYEITINNVIIDMEKCLKWKLTEEYFFISYSSRNVMKAMMLRRLLESSGCRVWIAPDGIPQGREYPLVIPTALRSAKHFVLLLTKESAGSTWVKRELDIAIINEANTKVKVLLADGYSVDDIRKDHDLNFYLNRVQVKYRFEDVIANQEYLNKFITE